MRVLCVSPRFAPANGADAHRLRVLARHLCEEGASVEVLAVDPQSAGLAVDPDLLRALPGDVPVHRVRAWPLSGWGLNGLAQRALVPLGLEGLRLLRERRFDLVFFSTTEFMLHVLGPFWHWRTGVPFCMDYQDPWVNDFYRATGTRPPGGRIKFGIAQWLHRAGERFVAPRCAAFLTVSPDYVEQVSRRHGRRLDAVPRLVAPFPAEPATAPVPVQHGARGRVWRYIGRGGADMARAAGAFFHAWRNAIEANEPGAGEATMELAGTSYAEPAGEPSIQPVAAAHGLASRVAEDPRRIPYGRTIELLRHSDALVVFGSDDAAYTASKIFPYLMARRPLLAIFHEGSPAAGLLRSVRGCTLVTFSPGESVEEIGARIHHDWFASRAFDHVQPLDESELAPYLAGSQARELLKLFEEAVAYAR